MDFTESAENCNLSETVISWSCDRRYVIPHIRPGYGPVAARKYPSIKESNSIVKNKNVLRMISFFRSSDYLEPIYKNETSIDQFSFLEFHCNKNFHDSNNRLKYIDKCKNDHVNKKYGSYADMLRFASQLPFMEVDIDSGIMDPLQQNHLKNFQKHKQDELNFSTVASKKEQSHDQFGLENPVQTKDGYVFGGNKLFDGNQNGLVAAQNELERSSHTGPEDYSVLTKNSQEVYNKLLPSELSDNHERIEHSPQKDLEESTDADKSKDFFDDAIMEHVRHHLLQLSSVESVVTTGPPSAITFHSSVAGKRVNEVGKVHFLLRWSPVNIVPDTWVAEDELCYNTQKTIPVSQLPPEALQPPVMDALGISAVSPRPGKRKRK